MQSHAIGIPDNSGLAFLCLGCYCTEGGGVQPLLLLDDDGIVRLMKLISEGTFGQIFITDARLGRSQSS